MSETRGTRRFWRRRRVRHTGHAGHHPHRPRTSTRIRNWLRRRTGAQRALMYGAAGLVATIAVAALILISPLASVFMTPRIVDAIEAKLGPGYQVDINSSRVDLTANGLDFRLDGFGIRDAGGATVFGVPSVAIALDGSLLVSQDVSLQRLR